MTIVQALYDAIHEESAAIAPQTSRLIEVAKVAALEITRLQVVLKECGATQMTTDPMSAPEFQGPRVPGDERFDEDVPEVRDLQTMREELIASMERVGEHRADIERMLVLRLAPSMGMVLAQTVVDHMKLLFAPRQ